MPVVSILIPAYKRQYLERAIASARAQTFEDLEILVGDDTEDGALADVVTAIDDPRLQYFHHGFQKGTRNCQALWERARGKYVKWLFDDDLLMPGSVEALVAALRGNPDAAMAFHERVFIDGDDNLTSAPTQLLKMGQLARLDRAFLAHKMVGEVNNFIGEPSNVMLDRERFDGSRLFVYGSSQLGFLGDVATYLNAAELGPVIAVGGYMSAFRQHVGQASNRLSPHMSAGLFEWELIVRGEAAAGHLSPTALDVARGNLLRIYTLWGAPFPEIARFVANLGELLELEPSKLLESARFQSDLAHARVALKARIANSRKNKTVQQRICAVCEAHVEGWLPHPAMHSDRAFMQQVGSVGSTLEHHLCPNCGCNDRERHLWLYLERSRLLADVSRQRILHVAPERGLEPKIRNLKPLEYITGGPSPQRPEHRKINVEMLDFPDDYFDLIICNHVLERVDRPEAALAQFNRCLAPGGHLIAQTPYSPMLKHTFELTTRPDEAFAARYFGQGDNVRLFGMDIVESFRTAGLNGDLYSHTTVLGDIDAATWGCNAREPFFLFANGPAPTFYR